MKGAGTAKVHVSFTIQLAHFETRPNTFLELCDQFYHYIDTTGCCP